MITPEEIKRLFDLARIEATPEELERLPKDVDAILNYVRQLQSLDLSGAAPTLSMAGQGLLRDDKAGERTVADTLLLTEQFPLSEKGFLKTKKVFE